MKNEIRTNQKIREAIKDSGLFYWKLADMLGISTSTMSVWMRHEMPADKQKMILDLIHKETTSRNG